MTGVAGAAAMGPALVFARSLAAAEFTFTQFHNQAEASSLHQRLVEMWSAIRKETDGRVDAQVFPENKPRRRQRSRRARHARPR